MTELYVATDYSAPYYTNEGIEILWGTRVIFIPKSETVLVQTNPSEVRELNINTFRLALKSLEDDADGMNFPSTHNHNTTVTLSGIVYARVVELINNFTVTFEDGQYAVNLVGANSNIADKVNVNQVSVRASNSAGLVSNNTPTEMANAVWNHATGSTIAVRLAEAWGRLGLDPTKPLVTGETSITFGDIIMAMTQTNNNVTVTRS